MLTLLTQSMRKNGNARSNAHYHPNPQKHPPPLASQDDTDSEMERFIRSKYEYRTFMREGSKSSGGTTTSSGSRSTSTSFGLEVSPPAPQKTKRSTTGKLGALFRTSSPGGNAKVSQILGTNSAPYTDTRPSGPVVFPHGMATSTPLELYGDQIRSLREMGFTDVSACLAALKQTDGKMMDAVEILIRQGKKAEETRPAPPPKAGLTVHKSGPARTAASSNPFDMLDKEEPPLPPLPMARTGGSVPMQHTMSLPVPQQQTWHQQQQLSPYNMNPHSQALPSNPFDPTPMQPQQQYPVATGPTLYPATTGSTGSSWNPFMSSVPASNPYQQQQQQQQPLQQMPQQPQSNPYQQQQQIPQQSNPYQQQPLQQIPPSNPYQQQQYQQPPNPYQQPPNPNLYQPRPIDKSSILALYAQPQLAPLPSSQPIAVTTGQPPPPPPQAPEPPMTGSNNPFLVNAGVGAGHMSKDSADFGTWQSGRHSPDAFASLAFGGGR
jgi:hypothetical protein